MPMVGAKLVTLVTACITTVVALGSGLVLQHAGAERAAIEQEAKMWARVSAQSVDREITLARALLDTLSVSPALESGDLAAFYHQASDVPKPTDSWIEVFDAEGRQILNTLFRFGAPLPEGRPPSPVEISALTVNTRAYVSDLVLAPYKQQHVVEVFVPVRRGGALAYLLAVAMPSEAVAKILDEHRLPEKWLATIYDRRGNGIGRSQKAALSIGQPGSPDLVTKISQSVSGTLTTVTAGGVPVFSAFNRSEQSGWTAVVAVPLAIIEAPTKRSSALIASGGGVLLLLGIGLALVTSRRIRRPFEARLQTSEELFRAMAETVPAILFTARPDGTYEYANGRFYEYTGVGSNTLDDAAWASLVHPDDIDVVKKAWARSTTTGAPYEGEFRLRSADGGYRWFVGRSHPIRDAKGRIVRWFGAASDIEDLKQTERALRESNEKRGAILTSITECYFTLDRAGRLAEVNRHFTDWTAPVAADPAMLIGRTLSEAFPGVSSGTIERQLKKALRTRTARHFESVSIVHPGHWLEFRVYPTAGGISVFFHDITERKIAELELRSARELLQSAVDALSAHIAILDASGHIIAVNEAWRRFADANGFRGANYGIGHNYLTICETGGEEGRRVAAGLRAVMSGARAQFRLEYPCSSAAEERWFQLRASKIGKGEVPRFVVAHEDITETKQAAVALEKLAGDLLHAQEEERRRIGRELHDSTAQNLAAAAMSTALLQQKFGQADDQAKSLITDITSLIDQSLQEIRNFSYLLHPPMLDEAGLPSALRCYIDGFAKRSGIDVTVTIPDGMGRLPAKVEMALFRVAQESLANIRRHSGSARARIGLRLQKGQIILEIADDGRGIEPHLLPNHADGVVPLGVGIAGMRARMRQLGGDLNIASTSCGTTVTATAPLGKVTRLASRSTTRSAAVASTLDRDRSGQQEAGTACVRSQVSGRRRLESGRSAR